ncbi:MAG: DNA mismatch repair endonuclease MutL [Pseudomonadota bacterium]
MTTIRILPEILSNQIAAGEVVERPVSIVKELIENSIDAGSTRIMVEVKGGGKSLIRVSDNGIGLCRDDALLCIERYATSKIYDKDDLFCISTMGFRGEALPSIASVSKFCLVTRTKEDDIATRIDMVGGKMINVSDVGGPVGTMIEVKSLFFNTPVRKKFLKSDQTEISHICDALSGIALGHPDIQFKLLVNHNIVRHYPASDDCFERTVAVMGKEVVKRLYKIRYETDDLTLFGYCADPMINRSTSSRIFLFVNRRLIHDRGLVSAVFQGYKGRMMKGRFPLAAIFVDIDFDQVDVNVHPSKREVRFLDHQKVYQAVSLSIARALTQGQQEQEGYCNTLRLDQKPKELQARTLPFRVTSQLDPYHPGVEESVVQWPASKSVVHDPGPALPAESGLPAESKLPRENAFVLEPEYSRIVGQVLGTYILIEKENALLLIDQHAAHERIVYESLLNRQGALKTVSQQLVVPETLELNFKEADALKGILDDLTSMGIQIEPFGGTTFVIKTIPPLIDEHEIKPMIHQILESLLETNHKKIKDNWIENALITMACHRAVRANKSMNHSEMVQLIHDLEKCENPMHCPHGRPIQVTMTQKELEKLFKRVV